MNITNDIGPNAKAIPYSAGYFNADVLVLMLINLSSAIVKTPQVIQRIDVINSVVILV
jgi:hypothetical protein